MNGKTSLLRVILGTSAVTAALVLNVKVSVDLGVDIGQNTSVSQGAGSRQSVGIRTLAGRQSRGLGTSGVAAAVPAATLAVGIVSAAHASGGKGSAQSRSNQSQFGEAEYGQPQRLQASKLTVKSRDGKRHVFTVEVARTPKEQEIGMMFRKSVEPDAGMLFLFPEPRRAAFWMYNTYIPLDLIFIDKKGRIESIAPNAAPHSLKPRQSRGVVAGVLEIAGGRSAELGIAEGDEILHPEIPRR